MGWCQLRQEATAGGRDGGPYGHDARGVLAYIALPALPSDVIVRSPKGKTVAVERFAGQARDARETCEGEAEGPA
jgi:hypothetical protein